MQNYRTNKHKSLQVQVHNLIMKTNIMSDFLAILCSIMLHYLTHKITVKVHISILDNIMESFYVSKVHFMSVKFIL